MNGILLIDKPEGWTSHDVVAKLRGILRERRIGHSGTLDPMATGLLVVFIGKATKAVEFAESAEKEYIAGLRLGVATATQDTTGEIIAQKAVTVTENELDAVLEKFTGEISQLPPMYSAIKINGQRLYKLARRGDEVERKARNIRIFKLERTSEFSSDTKLCVACSKGTYIRTLCHDIGEALGCGGAMSSLRRVRAGAFSVSDAYSIEQIEALAEKGEVETALMPVDSLFSDYGNFIANEEQEKKCRVGQGFAAEVDDGEYRVYGQDGAFLMLAKANKGYFSSIKNFFEVK